jgi:hypothetical protein
VEVAAHALAALDQVAGIDVNPYADGLRAFKARFRSW